MKKIEIVKTDKIFLNLDIQQVSKVDTKSV